MEEIFLGITHDNEVALAEINFITENHNYFSISFNCYRPIAHDEYSIHERIRCLIEDAYDDKTLLDLLRQYDCPYSELANVMQSEGDNLEWFDYSPYFDIISNSDDSVDYLFEFQNGGQWDCRNEIKIPFITKPFMDQIFKCWDNYHLKAEVSEDINKLKTFCDGYDTLYMERFIKDNLLDNL